MSNYINIYELPVVNEIIQSAEQQIKKKTGADVKLSVRIFAPKNIIERKLLLQDIVSQTFNQPWVKIISRSRKAPLPTARHMYTYFSKVFLRQSLSETGKDLGGRDHTTSINSLQQMQNYFDTNDEVLKLFEIIKNELPPLQ